MQQGPLQPSNPSNLGIHPNRLSHPSRPIARRSGGLAVFGAAALGILVLGGAPLLAQGPPDSNGFVMFRGHSFPVQESAGAVEVIVRRHNGDTGAVSVDIATVDGTALAGEDYTAASATLTWEDGDNDDKSLTIEILADAAVEGLETFGVELTNPVGGVELGALTSTVVRILPQGDDGDDDEPQASRIRLRSAVFPAFESAASATFVVVRQGSGAGAASVDYATVDGSATAGADYTATAGTLAWLDGETGPKSVIVPLLDDDVAERHESVSVMLTNAAGGELGQRDTASILIIDDDSHGDDDCVPGDDKLCLDNGRFALRGTWTDFQGRQGVFHAVPSTDGSGLFWFFNESSIEVIVKVIDGCALNDHRWLFMAATTNVAYRLEVTDQRTGAVQVYTNLLGTRAPATTDVTAFACTP